MKRFALAGNPNCGKTTLFNALTGSTAHVGNWPGVTVDKKEGLYKKETEVISIVDLPGIYSLSPYTPEEIISRNYILQEKPDCVINIVDCTNLERNLYLTTQVLEMDVPMIVALNMTDMLEKTDRFIDAAALEEVLGVPVVAISALREDNLEDLMHRAYQISLKPRQGSSVLSDSKLNELIARVKASYIGGKQESNPLFHAVKLIENDEIEVKDHHVQVLLVEEFKKTYNDQIFGADLEAVIADQRYQWINKNCSPLVCKTAIVVENRVVRKKKFVKIARTDASGKPICKRNGRQIYDYKFVFVDKIVSMVGKVDRGGNPVLDKSGKPIYVKKKDYIHLSDRIDSVLTNKWVGLIIFAAVLFLIFHLTFGEDLFYLHAMGVVDIKSPAWFSIAWNGNLENATEYFGGVFAGGGIMSPGVILFNMFDNLFTLTGDAVAVGLNHAGAQEWTSGLINDGVVSGVFAVLGFLPQILCLFLFFSILEDTGYMARVAFIVDRLFRKFGVSGRAFMPMIMGFGCSLPAMINTRTLNDEKERIATIRVIPFFSCGAKLPILTAISGAIVQMFGIGNADLITFGLYILGVGTAFITLIIMRNTTLKGEAQPFIMELPSYHIPGAKSLMIHLWDKAKHFVKKAFTIILISNIAVWTLMHFAPNWQYLTDGAVNNSILAQLSMIIQPIFTPLGFGAQLLSGTVTNAATSVTTVLIGWTFVATCIGGLIAKENVISIFITIASIAAGFAFEEGQGIDATVELIKSTGITVPAMIAFVAFNMTTIPCFAACATAKAELPKGKFKWTLLFWLTTSYLVGASCYIIGTWLWTIPIFVGAIAVLVFFFWAHRHGGIKKLMASFGQKGRKKD